MKKQRAQLLAAPLLFLYTFQVAITSGATRNPGFAGPEKNRFLATLEMTRWWGVSGHTERAALGLRPFLKLLL